jgi:hypothetical protein
MEMFAFYQRIGGSPMGAAIPLFFWSVTSRKARIPAADEPRLADNILQKQRKQRRRRKDRPA